MIRFNKNEKGSITLFVLIAMIFFLTIAFTAYASAMTKLQTQNEDIERIKASYEQDLTEEGLATLYEKLTTKVGKYAGEVLKTDANATEPEKKSPYVEYNGNLYRVLYDTSSPYGIEIVANSINKYVKLGKNDSVILDMQNHGDSIGELNSFKRGKWSYNNAISTLNKNAESYLIQNDGIVNDARCIGSIPNNKNYKNTNKYYNSSINTYFAPYNGQFDEGEQIYNSSFSQYIVNNANFLLDKEQMDLLEITKGGDEYWVASRIMGANAGNTYFMLRTISTNGKSIYDRYVCFVNRSGGGLCNPGGYNYGLRPVLHLAPGVKITGGEGTKTAPYTLGL